MNRLRSITGVASMCSLAVIGLCGYSAFALAEATCSTQDQDVRTRYTNASNSALLAGDIARYKTLQTELPRSLSVTCRRVLNELEPIRAKCNAEEKEIILAHYQQGMEALNNLDLLRTFAILEELEETISSECWLAANRHIDPKIQNACSVVELNLMASLASPAIRASEQLLTVGDMGPLLEIAQATQAQLSPRCFQAVNAFQQGRINSPNRAAQYQPSNVIDHGGGTYSVPGLGACTPSGCMAY